MKLHQLYPFPSEAKKRKRLGRGAGTGLGCTAGKGNKGQKARAGAGPAQGFEGGQMPMSRRLPKFGFKNKFRVKYAEINLEQIASKFSGQSEVSIDDLYQYCDSRLPIKVLGQGQLGQPITVQAHRFSASARQKIEQAGGQAQALEGC
jgi:large subunit ribosomal protein L15